MLDCLCERFPGVTRLEWISRFARERVLDEQGRPLSIDAPHRTGVSIQYFREVAAETPIPFVENILFADAHLVVVDKPHFVPVIPTGRFVTQCLLHRLIQRLGNPLLVPLHRLDRATAGLVLFSAVPATRSAYQALFREQRIDKHYEAIAAPLQDIAEFPHQRSTRLVTGVPFFRTCEIDGVANSLTRIDVLERGNTFWRYALNPITGKKHQLRVHMAALGAPIRNDDFYPVLAENAGNDWRHPLQLVARRLEFVDPLSGQSRRFDSQRELLPLSSLD